MARKCAKFAAFDSVVGGEIFGISFLPGDERPKNAAVECGDSFKASMTNSLPAECECSADP